MKKIGADKNYRMLKRADDVTGEDFEPASPDHSPDPVDKRIQANAEEIKTLKEQLHKILQWLGIKLG